VAFGPFLGPLATKGDSMKWFDIIKLARVGGHIEGGSYEGRLNKLLQKYEKGEITEAEYMAKRATLREQFGKMYDFN